MSLMRFTNFPLSALYNLCKNSKKFSSILRARLERFHPLNDDQFKSIFTLDELTLEGLKNFFPEHIPLLLATENLDKTKTILSFVRSNKQQELIFSPEYIPQLLRFHGDIVTILLYNNDQQARLPFLQLDDDGFNKFQNFSLDRKKRLAWNSKNFSAVLQFGLEKLETLDDDQFAKIVPVSLKLGRKNIYYLNNTEFDTLLKLDFLQIKQFKKILPEHVALLLATENFKKTGEILSSFRYNKQRSKNPPSQGYMNAPYAAFLLREQGSLIFPPQYIPQLLRFPLTTVGTLLRQEQHKRLPFLQLNDTEFNKFQHFSSEWMQSLIMNSKIFPYIVQFGLEKVHELNNSQFKNLIDLQPDQIQQLKELPFPQVTVFLELDYFCQRKLPFNLEQFKQYKSEKQNLPQENPPEVFNTSSKYQFEPDSK